MRFQQLTAIMMNVNRYVLHLVLVQPQNRP